MGERAKTTGIAFERAERAVAELLGSFGMDTESAELRETPRRVAAFWSERLKGYGTDMESILRPLPGAVKPCPVFLERIPFASTCEHHLAPFFGHVTLGYLPGAGGVVGLSKLIRLVAAFANRLQVQERMTWQIFDAIGSHLRPFGWGVRVEAEHTCIAHRGAKTPGVPAITMLLGGDWQNNPPKLFL